MSVTRKGAFILAVVLITISLFTNPSLAQVAKCDGKCGGKYHGEIPAKEGLKKILADHAKWLKTYKPASAD